VSFEAKKALEEDDQIGDLGARKASALLVVVPATREPKSSLRTIFENFGIECTTRDINHILNYDQLGQTVLFSANVTRDAALSVATRAKSAIKSATRNAIGELEGIFIDGSLTIGQGQTKSTLYYAYSESGGVLAAKVYNGHRDDYEREVEVNRVLDAGYNAVKFIKSFTIENVAKEDHHIIIMPFFPRSAADFLTQHMSITARAFVIIARDCFTALRHIHLKRYCYADLKPANIMLQSGENGQATLVDFGASVRLGSPTIEVTRTYCLNVDTSVGSERLDWTCLGTALAQLAGYDITSYATTDELADHVIRGASENDRGQTTIIVSCLRNSISKLEANLKLLSLYMGISCTIS
jgi:hypothetical protein